MGTLSFDDDEQYLKQAIRDGYIFSTSEVIRCHEEILKWQRIGRIVKRLQDVMAVRRLIMDGEEDELRIAWRREDKTRTQLLTEARELNVKNYGKLTKKELKIEIERYKRDKITRQRFERERK